MKNGKVTFMDLSMPLKILICFNWFLFGVFVLVWTLDTIALIIGG